MLSDAEAARVREVRARANVGAATDEDKQFVIDMVGKELRAGGLTRTPKLNEVLVHAASEGFTVPVNG